MSDIESCLVIVVGHAVSARLDIGNHRIPLLFDGQPSFIGDVVAADGQLYTGAAAQRLRVTHPDNLTVDPLTRLGQPATDVQPGELELVDAAAFVLGHVRDTAHAAGGEPPTRTTLLLPAAWGPRRVALIRQAAHRAELPDPHMVILASAAAGALTGAEPDHSPLGCVLVCDLRDGYTELTVAHRPHGSWQPHVTQVVRGAGSRDLDAAIAAHLTARTGDTHLIHRLTTPTTPADHQDADTLLADISQARNLIASTQRAAIVLPAPHPPQTLTSEQLHHLATPIIEAIAEAVAELLDKADITAQNLDAIIITGDPTGIDPSDVIGERFGQRPTVLPMDRLAIGAISTLNQPAPSTGARQADGTTVIRPVIGDVIASLAPAFASWLLLMSILDNSQDIAQHGPNGTLDLPYFDVLFNNAGFALTALLTMLATISGTRSFASALLRYGHETGRPNAHRNQVTRVLLGGAGFGLGFCVLYALLASALLGPTADRFLPLVLWPALPAATVTTLVALAAPRITALSGRDWTEHLRHPATPTVLAALGVALTQAAAWGVPWLPTIPNTTWSSLGGPLGTALLGVAAALTLTLHRWLRTGLGFLLGVGGALVYSLDNSSTMIIGYIICVSIWWLRAGLGVVVQAVPATRSTISTWWRNLLDEPTMRG